MSKLVFFNHQPMGTPTPPWVWCRELVARGNQVWYYSFAPLKGLKKPARPLSPVTDAALGMTPSPRTAPRVARIWPFLDLLSRHTGPG